MLSTVLHFASCTQPVALAISPGKNTHIVIGKKRVKGAAL
jgi:hypothetical protein